MFDHIKAEWKDRNKSLAGSCRMEGRDAGEGEKGIAAAGGVCIKITCLPPPLGSV